MKKKISNILGTIFLVISTVICLFAIAQRTIFKSTSVFGYRVFVIVTSSMKPDLYVGDVILVRDANNDIKVGDNITYKGVEGTYKDKVVTHKVQSIEWKDGVKKYTTKGLQNATADPIISEKQIYGKMVYKFFVISFLSKIIRSKIGFFLVIVVPLTIMLIKELLNFKKMLKKRQNNVII